MEVLNETQVGTQDGLVFSKIAKSEHEQIVFCNDPETGLKAIIGVHDSTLGPALGGCRMYNYDSEEDAIVDVLRLSKGMTYKASVSGLNLGGGKSVIIGDPNSQKSEAFFRKFGRFIESLNGKYITAEDVGTTTKDMEYIKMETNNVVGLPKVQGGGGDPSPVTAYGVYLGMKAAARQQYGKEDLTQKRILVEGVGKVGRYLIEYLAKENAQILVSDINEDNLKLAKDNFGAHVVDTDKIFDQEMDIYAPCALGATLNDESIPKLTANIVAGAANNQLAEEETHAAMLKENDILYAPDYLINAGGLINVYTELHGYNQDSAMQTTENIYKTTNELIRKARHESISTHAAANRMAEERIDSIGKIRLT